MTKLSWPQDSGTSVNPESEMQVSRAQKQQLQLNARTNTANKKNGAQLKTLG